MIGAIAGDIIGSVFEHRNVKSTDFELFNPGSRFTDDTVLGTNRKVIGAGGNWLCDNILLFGGVI